MTEDYLTINRTTWDERAPAHAASPGYAFDKFLADPEFLSHVVQFDLPRLGDLHGLRGVHLQCHIGTDTLSLARLGATMTGVDFAPAALQAARSLNERLGLDVDFVESDVYNVLDVLEPTSYDLVFTGIGALCWLPDIRRWAQVVAGLLRPGGRLFIREGHPMLWALEDTRTDGLLTVEYPYFEHPEPFVSDEDDTYVETDVTFTNTVSHSWNHGIGEVVTALMEQGMQLTMLVEHDSVPWEGLRGMMTDIGGGEWQLTDRPSRLPHSYT